MELSSNISIRGMEQNLEGGYIGWAGWNTAGITAVTLVHILQEELNIIMVKIYKNGTVFEY